MGCFLQTQNVAIQQKKNRTERASEGQVEVDVHHKTPKKKKELTQRGKVILKVKVMFRESINTRI